MSSKPTARVTVVPTLRYEDAPKMIDWLCRAFGFEKHMVVPGEGDTIAHAQLTYGSGMIMLGTDQAHGGGFDELQTTPKKAGGIGTQSAYVIVPDCDAHYAQARAAGAEIVLELEDKDYGGKGYTARDPEGHVWSFGDYDPFAEG